jgi:hypothetical protein
VAYVSDFDLDNASRLKKELDSVLSLQGELDSVDKAIQVAKQALKVSKSPKNSLQMLETLQETHRCITGEVEGLYVSLNIPESYPDLKGASLEFVRTLILARDLKVNIRKRAIGSFFEWDRLDQAVGGRNQALGKISRSFLPYYTS